MTEGKTFPEKDWETVPASAVGVDSEKLEQAKRWLDEKFEEVRYRVAIVRNGYLLAEWTHNIGPEERITIASANKSLLSSMLGIAIAEGKIASADDRVVVYYPEMMDVPEGEGHKEGRHAFEKDG